MKAIKVHFGAEKPKNIDYRLQPDGFAEVWIYKDVHEEFDAYGNSDFVADGVLIRTLLTEKEVEAQKDIYFDKPTEPEEHDQIKEILVEDDKGNKYKQVIKDGNIALELVEDYTGICHI